jgi:hypothetical protein
MIRYGRSHKIVSVVHGSKTTDETLVGRKLCATVLVAAFAFYHPSAEQSQTTTNPHRYRATRNPNLCIHTLHPPSV